MIVAARQGFRKRCWLSQVSVVVKALINMTFDNACTILLLNSVVSHQVASIFRFSRFAVSFMKRIQVYATHAYFFRAQVRPHYQNEGLSHHQW